MESQNNLQCPHCKDYLNMNDQVILTVEKLIVEDSSRQKRGWAFLSSTPGKYEVTTHEHFPLKDGEKLMIFCPLCNRSLESKKYHGLCYLLLNNNRTLYFAPDKGKHATFIEENGKELQAFGAHASEYNHLFPGSQLSTTNAVACNTIRMHG